MLRAIFISALFISVSLLVSHSVYANKGLPAKILEQKTQAFLQAKNARQQPNSSEKDIDHFISFLADEFIDEHVKFNVTVTDKVTLRKGMIAKLKDKIEFSNLDIDDMIIGRNVVFVQFTEHARGKPAHLDKVIEYKVTNLMSLEFNDQGYIKHIRRHNGI